MNETMTAIVQDTLGGPEVLHLAHVAKPVPGIGQIRIAVRAAGVNPVDAMNRQTGTFAGPPPFTLGWDVSGVVDAVGPGVTIVAPGDEVFGMLPFPHGAGGYASYAVGPARAFVPKPAELSHVEAAALPLAGLTAYQAVVETAHVTDGSHIVITGAAGGVGHLAVQIARAYGARITAVGSAGQLSLLTEWGAHEFIDYAADDFSTVVSGADIVFDTVGRDYPRKAVAATKTGGIVVTTLPQSLPEAVEHARAAGVRIAGLFVEADRAGMTAISDLVVSHGLRPRVAATYPLAEAAAAHGTTHGPGKVVLTVDPQ